MNRHRPPCRSTLNRTTPPPGRPRVAAGPGAPPPGAQAPAGNPYAAYAGTRPASPTPTLSIISLIAGIIGILGIWVVFVPVLGSILGLPIPLAAVILGFLGKRREPHAAKGLWLTGIILGFVGLAAALLALVIWLILFATAGATGYTQF